MSETKFTPGPWDLFEVGNKIKHLCPAKDGTSLLTVSLEYITDDNEATYFGSVYNPADAHLIAAAPDMYKALERIEPIIEVLAMFSPDHESSGSIAAAVKSAIAKARGEQ